jgi:hypothetical protein
MDLKYDLEKNLECLDLIILEMTEETDDISYKKLCDLFNRFRVRENKEKLNRIYWGRKEP